MHYAELQVTTNFTFLTGASHPEEMVMAAQALGHAAIGISDRNTLAGVVRAHVAAKECGLKLLIGCRLDFADNTPSILCYPKNRQAYGRLTTLLTRGKRRAEKGACHLYRADLLEFCEGQVLIVVPPEQIDADFEFQLGTLKAALDSPFYVAISFNFQPAGAQRLHQIGELAFKYGLALIATNDVHGHESQRRALQDILTCIRHQCSIQEAGFRLYGNGERHLKSPAEMARILYQYPQALENTLEVAKICKFSLDELRYEYPEDSIPEGKNAQAYLEELTWAGAKWRYPDGVPPKVMQSLQHELKLVSEMQYAPYFLTVYDIVDFARQKRILYQGRGSAANSAVCYCLGITAVNPDQVELLFERFLSKERDEPPDIDVDFEHERREEVIQYLYQRYGRTRAAIAATVITYRKKSAIRDVGKALGIPLEQIEDFLAKATAMSLRDVDKSQHPELIHWALMLLSFPRHLGQHVGGFILTRGPLEALVPIGNAAMDDRTFIEWDKDDIESLKMLKVDVLSLGMLSCIRRSFDLIKTHYHRELSLANVPVNDTKTYDMICRADTLGVFQIESRAQMSMLPRLRPRQYYDLVIEVALVRPGPIQGNMVHPYLKRRNGLERVSYPSKALESVLQRTLGVPLFQEQAMQVAIVGAGFTPGRADALRRAMATFKKSGKLTGFEDEFVQGMVKNGYDAQFANQCFQQILGFGDYGFPESHAASFALLAYVSAWLKCHYPAAFACALLNSQPMGFYGPSQILFDAKSHGVRILPIDVNFSTWDNQLVKGDLRLGFRQIAGIRADEIEWLVACRGDGYANAADLARRSGISERTLKVLASADAYGSFKQKRQQATWSVQGLDLKPLPLLAFASENPEEPVILPVLTELEEVLRDYQKTGLSLKNHPVAFWREKLISKGYLRHSDLRQANDGSIVKVAGLVLIRQRPPTASGMVFHTLEDETGFANIVITPDVCDLYRQETLVFESLAIEGKLQKKDGVIHVLAHRLAKMDFAPASMPVFGSLWGRREYQ
ncbi:MAG: error-prone DNA polymerase [Myxococcota bacterium]